ncbi:MAG: hypothetical protein KIC78_05375 [Prevotella sp.]|uniref:hypothetical protein n=1 Tax=Prevotella sp. TaxID=59823 RepID=UPI00257BEBD6|nr:hypothetical protein [Prevotella sp.]MBS5875587.1 hypothetical protein [Prevotella sp.]
MNDTIKPNAYLMRGALPSVERSRDEYTGSVFGSAALAYITIIHATDAMDMMQERLPELYDDRQIRKYINRMTGTKASMGEIRKLTLAIGELLAHDCDKAWVADFGNAAYEKVQPYTEKLRIALANALGRYDVPDINVCAAILVAQSLASEAVEYVKRRSAKFTNFTIVMKGKGRQTVSSCLSSMSCSALEYCLRNIARILVEDKLTDDVNIAEDKSVETGLKAVLNVMSDTNTWIYARDKADELNHKNNKK